MLQQQTDTLTAELVAEYLRDHPDFFHHYPKLVEKLSVPTSSPGAVSLVHVQMARQRQRIEELEEEITTLMSLAANNDRTFHEFMELQEQILKCDCLSDVCQAIDNTAQRLGLTAYIRFVDSKIADYAMSQEQWQRFSTNHFNGKPAYLGRLRKVDRQQLLGEHCQTPEMGSYVVLPLCSSRTLGVLAFASSDGGHFQPCMDTLFLRHLALVFSHLIDLLPWQRCADERIHTSST